MSKFFKLPMSKEEAAMAVQLPATLPASAIAREWIYRVLVAGGASVKDALAKAEAQTEEMRGEEAAEDASAALAKRLVTSDPAGDHVDAVAASVLANDEEISQLARTNRAAAQYRADKKAVALLDVALRAALSERGRNVPVKPPIELTDAEIEARAALLMREDPEVREIARTDRPAALLRADGKAIEQLTREKRQASVATGGAK